MTTEPTSTTPETAAGPIHVVIIVPYYWPILTAATHLMKDLAEGLAEEGCWVTVLSNGSVRANHASLDPPLLRGQIHRCWNPFLRRLGVATKFFEYLWFTFFFFFRGLTLPKVDLIFVVSTPPLAGLPASLLAWMKGAKMVYNLQDIFPDSAVAAGFLPANGRIFRWLRTAEEATYRGSDLVVSISPSFSAHVQHLVPGTQVADIPNWVDTDLIQPRKDTEDPGIAEFRRGGAFVVQYAGNIGFMQNLEVVVEAAERLRGIADIRFVFIGDGNAKQLLQELARRLGLLNCEFLPLQPLERVASVYNACDLGVIPLKPGAAHTAVPSKTWNYLAAARPVIGCVEEDSPLAQVIRESRSGALVPPGDAAQLAQTILDYWKAPDRVGQEGRQGRDYVDTNLSRRLAIQRYLQVFNRVLYQPAEDLRSA